MASYSNFSEKTLEHNDGYICKECVGIIVKEYQILMKRFFIKLHDFIQKEKIAFGYSTKIPFFSLDDISSSTDQYETDNAEKEENADIKTNIKIMKSLVSMKEEKSEECSVFFMIKKLFYVDLESIHRMFGYLRYHMEKNGELLKEKIKCSSYVPIIVPFDVVLYNESIIYHKKQMIPIGIQIKTNVYAHSIGKTINPTSTIELKIKAILNNGKNILNHRFTGKDLEKKHQFDITDLKEDVSLLFTELYDETYITYKCFVCFSKISEIHPEIQIDIPKNILQISEKTDIMFCIKNYNIIYFNNFFENYIDLFVNEPKRFSILKKHPSLWRIAFISLEKEITPFEPQNMYLYIGFFYMGSLYSTERKQLDLDGEDAINTMKRVTFNEKDLNEVSKKKLRS